MIIMIIILLIIILYVVICILIKKTNDRDFYHINDISNDLSNLVIDYNLIKTQFKNTNKWHKWSETDLYTDNKWKILPLYAFGKWIPSIANNFPELTKQLKTVSGLTTVLFSKMDPYTLINPHQGWAVLSNYVIRCHLGIDVPGLSFVGLGKSKCFHKTGQWFAFDDSKVHYAGNLSDKSRIILLVDIKRPNSVPKGISKVKVSRELVDIINIYFNKM